MSDLVVLFVGAVVFIAVSITLALGIWSASPSNTDEEARVLARALRARYELDLLAHEARERIAQVRSRAPNR